MKISYKKVNHHNRGEVYQLICTHEYSWRDSDPDGYKAKTEEQRQKSVDSFIHKQSEEEIKHAGFLAFCDDELAGGHILEIMNVEGKKACHIHGLWVDKRFRGNSIAKELKKLSETWALDNNCELMNSNVRANNEGMIAINKQLGYEIIRYNFRKPLKSF